MSQSNNYYTDASGNPFTNLVNPQVFDQAKGLACGWKWTCQDPNCPVDNDGWPNRKCSCCDLCDPGEKEYMTPEGEEYDEEPCCFNGTCCPCANIIGDAPAMYPQAVGCGRRHICKTIKTLPLCREQLDLPVVPTDHADLPGRPPHTIVCVRATGSSIVQFPHDGDCLQSNGNYVDNNPTEPIHDLTLLNPNCDSYNLWVRFKIPLEVIVRDCSGYLYCMNSFITELTRIPLTARIKNLTGTYIYAKTRVRLCYPNAAEATPLWKNGATPGADPIPYSPELDPTELPTEILECMPEDCAFPNVGPGTPFNEETEWPTFDFNCIGKIASNAWHAEDAMNLADCLLQEEIKNGCHYEYTFGTYECVDRDDPDGPVLSQRCFNGNPKLDILLEACVINLVAGSSLHL